MTTQHQRNRFLKAMLEGICFFCFRGKYERSPRHHKLHSWVFPIWENCRDQHIQSAKDKPRPVKTTSLIMIPPMTGKYTGHLVTHLYYHMQSPILFYFQITILKKKKSLTIQDKILLGWVLGVSFSKLLAHRNKNWLHI